MEAVISASAVSKYYGAKKALDDFSLEIFPGEVFGVIGPNGAGKTTFMRMLVDFIRPDSGDLKIWGLSPKEGGAKLRRNIGYLPGEVKISPQQTGRELIKFWVSAETETAKVLRHALELSEYLELDLEKKVGALSKGNKQKLGIVQAFMGYPELLILDEPTSGLDPVAQQKFLNLVTTANEKGATVFLSSHILQEIAQVAGRAAVLREGKLLRVDSVENLKSFAKQFVKIVVELRSAQTESEIVEKLRPLDFALIPNHDGRNLEFTGELAGDVNELIKVLASYQVKHLVVSEPDLMQSVMTMYEGRGQK